MTLRLRGRMLERFVTRAVEHGVCFVRIRRVAAREMLLTVGEKDAQRLTGLAQEYRMDLTVDENSAGSTWKRRLYERSMLLLALLPAAVLLGLFLSRIWIVQVSSEDDGVSNDLLRAVERSVAEWGIKPGASVQIDREELASFIQLAHPSLTYVNVRRRGVRLWIEVAAENPAPEVYELGDSRDLVACRDALIVYAEPLTGQLNVKAGDTVRKGQVLIYGRERTEGGTLRSVRALGTVIARVWFTGECSLPLSQTVVERTGRSSTGARLSLYHWSVTLDEIQSYASQQTEEEYLPVGGMFFPLRIVRTTNMETYERTVQLYEEELKRQGERRALEQAYALMPEEARQTACWTEYSRKDDSLTVRVTIEAQMNIAAERGSTE
jgi:similar to stage IV sporulation protein